MRLVLRRLRTLARITGSLAVVVLLWSYRPSWPQLPSSRSAPVTIETVEQIAVLAAWFLANLVILALLLHRPRALRADRSLDLDRISPKPSPRRAVATSRGLRVLPVQPKLLLAGPRDAGPRDAAAAAPAEAARSSEDTSIGREVAGPAEQPLVSLLGPLRIEGAKRSRRGLRARALEVIAFLALRPEGAQRDEILEALWPGEDPERSRHRLYQAVRDARRLLGDAVASERDRYWLDREQVRVDVDQFEYLIAEADQVQGADREQHLKQALALVRAEPLAGCDYVWAEGELRQLRGAIVSLLERLGATRLEAGDPAGALALAEQAMEVDALNEAACRLAMKAEGVLGLREAIVDRYERLAHQLDERLGLEPERKTRGLYLRLLSQS